MQEIVSSATRNAILELISKIKEGFCHEEKTRKKNC